MCIIILPVSQDDKLRIIFKGRMQLRDKLLMRAGERLPDGIVEGRGGGRKSSLCIRLSLHYGLPRKVVEVILQAEESQRV